MTIQSNRVRVIDGLTNLTRAIGEDGVLRHWFYGLAKKPIWERRQAIFAMCERIASEGSHEELVNAFKMLAIPKIFEAARTALMECGFSEE